MNLATPKAGAEDEISFNKPNSEHPSRIISGLAYASGTVLTKLYFLRKLRMGPKSQSDTLLNAGKAFQGTNTLAYWGHR
jgi:hypothetical protein